MRIILFKPTIEEVNTFNTLQADFIKPSFLVHFQSNYKLYINLNTSKKKEIGIIVYYIKGDFIVSDNIKQGKIKPILFLSRMLLVAKLKYQPTKFKITGLVWIIKKVRHMVTFTI